MKKLFTIADTLKMPNGSLVLAGTDSRFDGMSDIDIRRMVGHTVRVQKTEYKVSGVETATSLTGGKNVFIKINTSKQHGNLSRGQVAYIRA